MTVRRTARSALAGLLATVALALPALGAAQDPLRPASGRSERGPVSATIRVEPAEVRIGDPVTVTLAVTAEPGIELLMPVFGTSLDRFTILEFVPQRRVDDEGRAIETQRYRLDRKSVV